MAIRMRIGIPLEIPPLSSTIVICSGMKSLVMEVIGSLASLPYTSEKPKPQTEFNSLPLEHWITDDSVCFPANRRTVLPDLPEHSEYSSQNTAYTVAFICRFLYHRFHICSCCFSTAKSIVLTRSICFCNSSIFSENGIWFCFSEYGFLSEFPFPSVPA